MRPAPLLFFIFLISLSVHHTNAQEKLTINAFLKLSKCSDFNPLLINKSPIAKPIVDSVLNSISKSTLAEKLNENPPLTDCPLRSFVDEKGHSFKSKNGKGIFIDEMFSCYAGTFADNQFLTGIALVYSQTCDSLYIGHFERLQKNGTGFLLLKSGEWLEGEFADGSFIKGIHNYYNNEFKQWMHQNIEPAKPVMSDYKLFAPAKDSVSSKTNLSPSPMHAPQTICKNLHDVIYNNDLKSIIVGYFDRISFKVKDDYEARRLNINYMTEDFYSGGYRISGTDTLHHGKGLFITKNKSYFSGKFKNGEFWEGWAYIEKDSCQYIYIGQIESFKFHGSGLLIKADGSWFYGLFEKGIFKKGEAEVFNTETNSIVYGKYSGGYFKPKKRKSEK